MNGWIDGWLLGRNTVLSEKIEDFARRLIFDNWKPGNSLLLDTINSLSLCLCLDLTCQLEGTGDRHSKPLIKKGRIAETKKQTVKSRVSSRVEKEGTGRIQPTSLTSISKPILQVFYSQSVTLPLLDIWIFQKPRKSSQLAQLWICALWVPLFRSM